MNAQTFIDALHAVEDRGDVEPMAALHADDAELRNPTHRTPQRGPDGARHFWASYRGAFGTIRSDFHHVVDGDGASLMEWTSEGTLADGTPVRYGGVTVVEWADGRVRRFRAYFDPADLTTVAGSGGSGERR